MCSKNGLLISVLRHQYCLYHVQGDAVPIRYLQRKVFGICTVGVDDQRLPVDRSVGVRLRRVGSVEVDDRALGAPVRRELFCQLGLCILSDYHLFSVISLCPGDAVLERLEFQPLVEDILVVVVVYGFRSFVEFHLQRLQAFLAVELFYALVSSDPCYFVLKSLEFLLCVFLER